MPYMYIAFSTLTKLVSGLLVCREERELHEKFPRCEVLFFFKVEQT